MTVSRLRALDFSISSVVPSLITGAVLTIVLAIQAAFWPYGIFAIVERMFRDIIIATRKEMAGKDSLQQTTDAVTIGVFSIFWVPFFTALLPPLVFGGYINLLTWLVEIYPFKQVLIAIIIAVHIMLIALGSLFTTDPDSLFWIISVGDGNETPVE